MKLGIVGLPNSCCRNRIIGQRNSGCINRASTLFVSTPEQKTKIHERFDAIACEMEGGSIGHVCYVNKVPFAILRSISDGEGASMDYATFAEKAALQSILVVIDFIQRADELQA